MIRAYEYTVTFPSLVVVIDIKDGVPHNEQIYTVLNTTDYNNTMTALNEGAVFTKYLSTKQVTLTDTIMHVNIDMVRMITVAPLVGVFADMYSNKSDKAVINDFLNIQNN